MRVGQRRVCVRRSDLNAYLAAGATVAAEPERTSEEDVDDSEARPEQTAEDRADGSEKSTDRPEAHLWIRPRRRAHGVERSRGRRRPRGTGGGAARARGRGRGRGWQARGCACVGTRRESVTVLGGGIPPSPSLVRGCERFRRRSQRVWLLSNFRRGGFCRAASRRCVSAVGARRAS